MDKNKLIRTDRIVIAVIAVLFLAITIVTLVIDSSPEWKYYQNEFRLIASEKIDSDAVAKIPSGIQQLWIEDLDRVDRCTTCHQSILWEGFENEEQPYATHPNLELFKSHPIEDYGCSVCHGGQGYAVDKISAHGFVKHWEEPLLSGIVASDYNIKDRNALVEVNCNVCHRLERETVGMPYINLAKNIIQDKACWGCHRINGEGGTLGPDLTNIGDKHAEGYDWNRFDGFESVFNWHIQHFDEPTNIVPNTIMPKLGLQTMDRHALSMLMMSWKSVPLPVNYIPGYKQEEELLPEERETRDRLLTGDGAFFIEKGCFVCHAVSAFDIKSPTEKGPDLTFAIDDTRDRFGQTLEEFIFDPSQSGTMKIIFGEKVILTDQEKWKLIEILTKAYHIDKKSNSNLVN